LWHVGDQGVLVVTASIPALSLHGLRVELSGPIAACSTGKRSRPRHYGLPIAESDSTQIPSFNWRRCKAAFTLILMVHMM